MNKIILVCGILLSLFWGSKSVQANEVIKIEDFAQLPEARNLKISPDGKYLSVVFNKSGREFLGILDRNTRKVVKTLGVKGKRRAVGNVRWVNNKRLIYSVTMYNAWQKTVFESGELMGVNVDGTKHQLIFGYKAGEKQVGHRGKVIKAAYGSQQIIDMLTEDDEHILIAFYPWKKSNRYWRHNSDAPTTIYKLNVYTGQRSRIDSLPLPDSSAITDNNGELRFSIGKSDDNELVVHYKDVGSTKWKQFDTEGFEGKIARPLSFAEDNNQVYVSAYVKSGTRALYLFDLEKHTYEKIFHSSAVDISRFIFDFSGRKVVAVATELALPEYHYLEEKDPKAKLHRFFQKSFKGSDVLITSETDDASYVIALVYSDINPGDYYLYDTNNKKAEYLLTRRSKIFPEFMSKTNLFKVKVRDGEIIHGYLTLPKDQSKQPALVVVPHGGPHGVRDEWGYDWQVQLLANRGYAVLQVNFRGSGGFGLSFKEAGYGKWGTLMQDDITDATQKLINQGIVDPERICIYGASYGAYAALMGAVREPSLYKCAIGSAGIYNLPMMFVEGDIADKKSGIAYLKEAIGEDIEDQKRRSPVFNVAKITADILLIHGTQDERAPIEQVESLKQAFDVIGKKYQWLEIPFEGHGYYDEDNRLKVYTKILEFLEHSIGSESSN